MIYASEDHLKGAKKMAKKRNHLLNIILPVIVFIHTLLFILYWTTNSLFYTETNDFLAKMIGINLDYISICLWFAIFVGLWSLARIILTSKGIKHRLSRVTDVLYAVIGVVFIIFFYGSFWKLFSESPVQIPRLMQMIAYYRLILDSIVLIGIALGLGFWVRGTIRGRAMAGMANSVLPILLAIVTLIVIWGLAVIYPPGSVYHGELPAKPLLIAHRGASMIAPENTISAAARAAELGVYGLETDIHISLDGRPFLLHDDTFVRTTDVEQIFPDRATERAEYFTLAEATQLNAGEWFVERDPYGTIGSGEVSDDQVQEYLVQSIPTLADEMDIVLNNSLVFIYDVKQPPSDQPYAQSFFEICLNEIHAVGVDPQVWVLADENQKELVRSIGPEMKLAYGVDYQAPPTAVELKGTGYEIVNAEYGLAEEWIQAYQEAGLWVNLYTIDEPWQYSRLWLLGVDSTTSSNVHTMVVLDQPIFSLTFGKYLFLWSIIGIVCLGLVLGLTIPVYNQSKIKTAQSN
jgi:glycerophosphoryl diester phosphodiesterase